MTEQRHADPQVDVSTLDIIRTALAAQADAPVHLRAAAFHELRDSAQRAVRRRRVIALRRAVR